MEPTLVSTEEVTSRFGFDPDQLFPNREFWSVEDGRLHVVLPRPESLSDEERAQLESVEVAPATQPNFLGEIDSQDGREFVFLPLDGSVPRVFAPMGGSKGSMARRPGLLKRLVGALARLPLIVKF